MAMEDINQHIINGNIRITVKTKSRKTEVTGYDSLKKSLIVNVSAIPEDNKANIEIIKYFSRILKKKVRIKSGSTGKEKILAITD